MSDLQLIDAVKTGRVAKVEEALNARADIHQQDEQGWTPLNWAAGMGDLEIVKLLLDRGVDVFRVGRDQRTPYKIALAAKHVDVAQLLKQAEQGANGGDGDSSLTSYAKAYQLGELRKFAGWREEKSELTDSDVVFLHQDFTVTQLIWPGENVIYKQQTPEWQEFCERELQFRVPTDFDLVPTAA
jgi:hypothetical protein